MFTFQIPAASVLRAAVIAGFLGALGSPSVAAPATVTPFIKIDQFGYLNTMKKVAVVVSPQVGSNAIKSANSFKPGTEANQYQVRRWADDVVVASGTLQPWRNGATHAQSGDQGWSFDFSVLMSSGSYYVYDTQNKVGSGRFEIGPRVYDTVLRHVVRTFFYQRINQAKAVPYADPRWTDASSYEGAGQDRSARSRWAKNDASTARDLSGGWMDAGDTNKYTTFAESAVLQLLDAYRFNPGVFGDAFGIPESGNGVSDLLDEIKWELEFLKRMQNATGTDGLLLKVGVDHYGSVSPLSADTRPRYYLPECTSATLAGSAMFASAGVVYKATASQAAYGNDLIARAERAWARAKTTTANFTTFQTACDDGDIKSGNADVSAAGQMQSALLAAIYLYEATGKAQYQSFVESHYTGVKPISNGWWGPYNQTVQVALLRYADLSGASASAVSAIRVQKEAQKSVMSITDYNANTDLYRAYVPDAQYHWGHNEVRANTGNLNLDFASFTIDGTNAALYREVAHQHLHWLHGANPLGLVMLSHMGPYGVENSVNEIYHAWFDDGTVWDNASTSPNGPPPGYLTGGPNPDYSGSVPGITDQPPQKAYKDWNSAWPENSWELSEPAIYTQAAYIQLLARIMVSADTSSDTQAPSAPSHLSSSTDAANNTTLTWTAATDNIGVAGYDLYSGSALLASGLSGTRLALNSLSAFNCGTSYALVLKARDAAGNTSEPSNTLTVTTPACPTASTVLYADALGLGWQDWSWSSTRDFANAAQVKVGAKSVQVDFAGWGGLSLRHATGIATSANTTLNFWAYTPLATQLRVSVQTQDSGADAGMAAVDLPAKKWTYVAVTYAQMGNPGLIKRVNIQLGSATANTVYFDQIQLGQ